MEISDEIIEKAVSKYPEKAKEYRSGNTGLLGLFLGEVMKMTKGTADPKTVNRLIKSKLEQMNE